jgi:hypothetical protein
MGKQWSDERHLKLAVKRMNDIKSGKATTRFWMGPVVEFTVKGVLYQFCVTNDSVELEITDQNGKDKTLVSKRFKGKKFEAFLGRISEWLNFPMGYVVYKKKVK